MRRTILLTALTMGIWAAVSAEGNPSTPSEPESPVVRGAYLVKNVAMCADCHSPRLQDGSFDPESWLEGGPLDFAPTVSMPFWAEIAPPIAGLPGYTVEEAVALLETAELPGGQRLLPPMPAYRMSHEDAVAVVAYLKSLGG